MTRLLLLGATGMLGQDVAREARSRGWQVTAPGRDGVDLTDRSSVAAAVANTPFDAVINAAAHTAVDDAQTQAAAALAANATGVAHLARACAAADIPLVHVSTDYVFSGLPPHGADGRPRGWLPDDSPDPVNVYGATKLAGEWAIAAAGCPAHVVRVSWLAGAGGPSFVATMLRLAGDVADGRRDGPLRVVADQWGRLTTTGPLAARLCDLAVTDQWGTHHLTHTGPASSWWDLAEATVAAAGLDVEVAPCGSDEFPRPAPRPGWSVLDDDRLPVAPLGDWRDALEELVGGLAVGRS